MEAINNGNQTPETRESSKILPSHLHHYISLSVGAPASSTQEMLLHLTQQSPPPQPVVGNALGSSVRQSFQLRFDCRWNRIRLQFDPIRLFDYSLYDVRHNGMHSPGFDDLI